MIDKRCIYIQTSNPVYKVFDIGVRKIGLSKPGQNGEMPVSQWTIAQVPIDKSKEKP